MSLEQVLESKGKDGYYDKDLDAHIVSVMAGFYHWTRAKDVAFSTMLGSCVSVCAYDEYAGIGGMNHFLLPNAPKSEEQGFSSSFRYGSAAIETLLNSLFAKGAAKNGLKIKLFGGAKVLGNISNDVGDRNISFTKNFFKRENIRIESEDLGGSIGRRIIFFPATGKVLLRELGNSKDIARIVNEETKILENISTESIENDVELF